MMLRLSWLLMALVLFAPRLAWADAPGIQLYESGDYEAALQSFSQVLADARSSARDRAQARIYLAASLQALGRAEEARKQLETLAREHPEERVDAVRFPPEVVALAEAVRQQVETERAFAQREAEREREAREEALRRLPPPAYVRPEAFGLHEVAGGEWTVGAGVAYQQGPFEGGVRVVLNADPAVSPPALFPLLQVQGGWLLGNGGIRPWLGVRAILVPRTNNYGAGAVAGVRIPLVAGLVGWVDAGADYIFFRGNPDYRPFAVTVQGGLGFDVRLPWGRQ